MPAYDFRCKKCKRVWEATQGMNDPNPACTQEYPSDAIPWEETPGNTSLRISRTLVDGSPTVVYCGGDTEKLITSAAAVHFQGSGWAKDGYSK